MWGDRVFVSAVHSDDEYEKPKGGLYNGGGRGEPPSSVHHWMVYCLELSSGRMLWSHEAHVGKPQIPRHPKNTYAAETPTTDGKRVYVLFGDVGLYCYDFDGKPLWSPRDRAKEVAAGLRRGGVADRARRPGGDGVRQPGGVLHRCLRQRDRDSSGWKTIRDEKSTWCTPLVWQHDGTTEIVANGKKENRSYTTDGELLWHFNGRMSSLTIPSPFVVDGLLYITSAIFKTRTARCTR